MLAGDGLAMFCNPRTRLQARHKQFLASDVSRALQERALEDWQIVLQRQSGVARPSITTRRRLGGNEEIHHVPVE